MWLTAAVLFLAMCIAVGASFGQSVHHDGVIYLDQVKDDGGRMVLWSIEERRQFYHTSSGTQIVPYDWFLALEQSDSGKDNPKLFMADDNISQYGLLPDAKHDADNPDALPVGFAKTSGTPPQLGITCAFCHTSQIRYTDHNNRRHTIRIEGGSSMQYNFRFLKEMGKAFRVTLQDRTKFTRFAKNVLKADYSETHERKLHRQVTCVTEEHLGRSRIDPIEWGFGRNDALGRGGNRVFVYLDPDNLRHENAPVSIPSIWGAWEYDWVQWNGSIRNPLARNIGQVIGVGAGLDFEDPDDRFSSSVDLINLNWLESQVRKLQPPSWPDVFPPIDQKLAQRGKDLYHGSDGKGLCAGCHVPRELNKPTPFPGQRWRVHMVRIEEIGTDPLYGENFRNRTAETGVLGLGRKSAAEATEYLTTKIMERAGIHVGANKWRSEVCSEKNGEGECHLAYMARPHKAIWATPPYLHNGSVPNLYELLLPVEERDSCFYIGSPQFDGTFEFDPKQVGFVARGCDFKSNPNDPHSGFEFDTGRLGNSNAGHEFRNDDRAGHAFTPAECEQLTKHAKDGILGCELQDNDRWAIIEYLKTL